ncbi:MAG: TetR/AcrR family transcriptional regulator [Proteobacteria bacterium]|nr:TetR/AcrR family transcriptional regulator [Pseudomonadota bacterium]
MALQARRDLDFSPRKLPAQQRSRVTFDAIVEACTCLLPERGYAGTTTNHIAERAGVNIASLYEYFPGKDAIVAQVAERLVDRVLARLTRAAIEVSGGTPQDAMRHWIEWIYDTVASERELVSVFLYQVPYTNRLEPIQAINGRMLGFSRALQQGAGGFVRDDFGPASLHLVVNLVTSTILQLVFNPPEDIPAEDLLEELTERVDQWIRAPNA